MYRLLGMKMGVHNRIEGGGRVRVVADLLFDEAPSHVHFATGSRDGVFVAAPRYVQERMLRLPRAQAPTSLDRDARGHARLRERLDAALPALWLYGAGHVGQAVARILVELPLRLTWVDARAELFPAGLPPALEILCGPDPVATVAAAPAGARFLVLTHSHALDYELSRAILRRGDFAWAGLIGSASKAARFRSRLARDGVGADAIARLVCPIGVAGIASKWPAAIAVRVAAQILREMSAVVAHEPAASRPATRRCGRATRPSSGRSRSGSAGSTCRARWPGA
jgi:xanthine dehydrogenase accessory protein XdhC